MSSKDPFVFPRLAVFIFDLFFGLTVAGCASFPPNSEHPLDDSDAEAAVDTTLCIPPRNPDPEDIGPAAALRYNQGLSRLTPTELARERSVLVTVSQTPFTQVRMALLLGHPRVQQDLSKGLALLESVLKSSEPAAISFHPLARQISENYQERMKLESQLEKQGQQLKESLRKNTELQEKLDSLANIEQTLIPRPRAVGPNGDKK